jgi:hypothetical protein
MIERMQSLEQKMYVSGAARDLLLARKATG